MTNDPYHSLPSLPQLGAALIGLVLGGVAAVVLAELVLQVLPVCSGRTIVGPDQVAAIRRWDANRPYVHSNDWRMEDVQRATTNADGFTNPQIYRADGKPLIAVVGDSFVEAEMLNYRRTFFGQLDHDLHDQVRCYSFGMARASLAEYVALATYARDHYHPEFMVFNIVQGDVADSELGENPRFCGGVGKETIVEERLHRELGANLRPRSRKRVKPTDYPETRW